MTVLAVEVLVLVSRPVGLYPKFAAGATWLTAFIGPVWPGEALAGILIVGSAAALAAHRSGLLCLDQPEVALDLLGEAGQWAMLVGLTGTFLGLLVSVTAIDGRLEQQEMLAALMRGTGTAIGSSVASTIEGLLASVLRFIFARIWR
jgi:hypothetical protein